jgi:hypothetical protein
MNTPEYLLSSKYEKEESAGTERKIIKMDKPMSKPTVGEMVEWLSHLQHNFYGYDRRVIDGIISTLIAVEEWQGRASLVLLGNEISLEDDGYGPELDLLRKIRDFREEEDE